MEKSVTKDLSFPPVTNVEVVENTVCIMDIGSESAIGTISIKAPFSVSVQDTSFI